MSLLLNGSEALQITDTAALTFPDGDWTLAAWIKLTNNTGSGYGAYSAVFSWGEFTATPSINWVIYQNNFGVVAYRNKVTFSVKDSDADLASKQSTGTYGTSTSWQHFTLVRSSGVFTQYFNGSADGTDTDEAVDAVDVAAVAYCGFRTSGVGIVGRIAEYARWSRALSAGEITALAGGAAPGDYSTNLDWWLPLLDDKEADVGSLTTALVGSPSWDADDHPVTYAVGEVLVVGGAECIVKSESPALVQHQVLVVGGAECIVESESPALVQHQLLTVGDAESLVESESPALTQHQVLVVGGAECIVESESPSLTQRHVLAVDDARCIVASQNVTLDVGAGGATLFAQQTLFLTI